MSNEPPPRDPHLDRLRRLSAELESQNAAVARAFEPFRSAERLRSVVMESIAGPLRTHAEIGRIS